MLDFRHQTFLAVYRMGSYTKAAAQLNLTQPAVSQHIKALEERYGCPLFVYANKVLTPTEQGRLLYQAASRIASDSDLLAEKLRQAGLSRCPAALWGNLEHRTVYHADVAERGAAG